MKALMYHYVRKFDHKFPYSKFKDLDTFSSEILALQKLGYTFKNVTDALKSLINKEDTSKVILLTFDDGLKDHLSVAKILNKIGIKKATFYISTKPYLTNSILHVHKSHLILSNKGEKALDFLLNACEKLNISIKDHLNYKIEKENYINAYSRFNTPEKVKEFKRLINFYGSIGTRDILLEEIIKEINIKTSYKEIYLSLEEIKKISDMGFEIGSHGRDHTLLSRLNKEEQLDDLLSSKLFLEGIISKSINSFCYPYGGKKSYNKTTLNILKQIGYHNAFSVDPREITKDSIKSDLYQLPRYDCNQIDSIFLK